MTLTKSFKLTLARKVLEKLIHVEVRVHQRCLLRITPPDESYKCCMYVTRLRSQTRTSHVLVHVNNKYLPKRNDTKRKKYTIILLKTDQLCIMFLDLHTFFFRPIDKRAV